ncbi:hypothetical protein SAMN04487895_112103 [Paenibacillus sophorae]|uniref:Uncharacterized protein n=1 Tax=Paenibacillus sophorae TaxID=1333845 RepID=A0A1H8STG9_9BACL|nr:hypothetical protein [Paenibacillus sophorae]QWU15562.1 hypothetical protein KP014_27545 [Paenibacillus sophorae]SEO82060.1 hypothetical protein SAMN04487895_112103 [Paenibacillus sophorae]
MLESIKQLLKNNPLSDVYLAGSIDIEDGIADFCPDMRFLYFELGEKLIEFESINQYSKLSLKIVDSVRYQFEFDEDMLPGKSSVRHIILTDSMSATNGVKNINFYNLEEQESQLICDGLQIRLVNGQELFLDPSFYFGINIGGLEQKKFWVENLTNDSVPNETFIEIVHE